MEDLYEDMPTFRASFASCGASGALSVSMSGMGDSGALMSIDQATVDEDGNYVSGSASFKLSPEVIIALADFFAVIAADIEEREDAS